MVTEKNINVMGPVGVEVRWTEVSTGNESPRAGAEVLNPFS